MVFVLMKKKEGSHASVGRDMEEYFVIGEVNLLQLVNVSFVQHLHSITSGA
jgi:hypothetical protein